MFSRAEMVTITVSSVIFGLFLLISPSTTQAFPFGGQASVVAPCFNSAIYANLGPPIGGPYIWTPATRTYQFGPPQHAGQWLLGNAGAPYFCIVSIQPLIVWPGTHIVMMGSSGPAAPAYSPSPISIGTPSGGGSGTGSGSGSGSGTPASPSGPTSIGHIVISEVYYDVDSTHGTETTNEWVELYNSSTATTSLSGWSIGDASVSRALSSTMSLGPAEYMVIAAATSTVSTYWTIPNTAKVVILGNPIGSGLNNPGDAVVLRNAQNTIVDAVSWGSDTFAFTPSVSIIAEGHSAARSSLATDTNAASDWTDRTTPTPGK